MHDGVQREEPIGNDTFRVTVENPAQIFADMPHRTDPPGGLIALNGLINHSDPIYDLQTTTLSGERTDHASGKPADFLSLQTVFYLSEARRQSASKGYLSKVKVMQISQQLTHLGYPVEYNVVGRLGQVLEITIPGGTKARLVLDFEDKKTAKKVKETEEPAISQNLTIDLPQMSQTEAELSGYLTAYAGLYQAVANAIYQTENRQAPNQTVVLRSPKTKPAPAPKPSELPEPQAPRVETLRPLRIKFAQRTDQGRVRDGNEDRMGNEISSPEKRGHLFVVADGMGGLQSGEIASKMAVDSVLAQWKKVTITNDDKLIPAFLDSFVSEANLAVFNHNVQRDSMIGTTLTLLLIKGNTAYIAHIGDSRVCLLRGNQYSQITTDQTQAHDSFSHYNNLTQYMIRQYPGHNILTQAIGLENTIEVELHQIQLIPGDKLLICTDGLDLSDTEIAQILTRNNDPDNATKELTVAANDVGGEDNITEIVVFIEEEK